MTIISSAQQRSPFVRDDRFIETAFERRFQGLLRQAWQYRTWHIVAAVPGSGKSFGIHDLVRHCGACKESTGITRLPLLAIRAPKNAPKEIALGIALSAAFGVVPPMAWAVRRIWLVQAMARAQVGGGRVCQRMRYLQMWNVQLTQLWKCCARQPLTRRRSRVIRHERCSISPNMSDKISPFPAETS